MLNEGFCGSEKSPTANDSQVEGADIEGHLQGLASGSQETNLKIQHSGLASHLLLQRSLLTAGTYLPTYSTVPTCNTRTRSSVLAFQD